LKVVQLYKNETSLIKKAIKNNREAQQRLFTTYSPKMLSICRQYINDIHHAEDAMIVGFSKVFIHLNSFKFEGSFEGWIRKIMVRQCLSFLRTQKKMTFIEEIPQYHKEITIDAISSLEVDEIQQLIDDLPEGYRVVFVMQAIEGYSHKEIAALLNISEGTSKSQLFKARKMLKENFFKRNTKKNGTE